MSQFAGLAGIVKKGKAQEPAAQAEIPETMTLTSPAVINRRRAIGKSANPDYERLTVYVRKETKKAAERKADDAGEGDMSDLVQSLLTSYLDS